MCVFQPFSEEIFGPVAPLFRFTDEQAVVTEANDSKYVPICLLHLYSISLISNLYFVTLCEQAWFGFVCLHLEFGPHFPYAGRSRSWNGGNQ
jgi:hypothetical protein